jgi:hypothetical protein
MLLRWQPYQKHKDHHTWRQRVTRKHEAWKPLMEDLVAAYLKWKYPAPSAAEDDSVTAAPLSPESSEFNFMAEAVDLYSLATSVVITWPPSSKSPAIDAVAHGYLSPIPSSPSILVSIPTLELFRRIWLCKPTFSIEAFAKVICDLYSVRLPPSYSYTHFY